MKRLSVALAGALTVAMALAVEAAGTEQQQSKSRPSQVMVRSFMAFNLGVGGEDDSNHGHY
jgi:hypothetical protein